MRGILVAFEGLDQSGKQTQTELLRDYLAGRGRSVRLISFPDYTTHIGQELRRALGGQREYPPDVMQLLYVANRHEWKPAMDHEKANGTVLVCDRYVASSIAYGEAQGLDPAWLTAIQRHLPPPDVTILLDITPEVSVQRKTQDRDRYERDMALLTGVRESYLRQAREGWVRLDATRDRQLVASEVIAAVDPHLAG